MRVAFKLLSVLALIGSAGPVSAANFLVTFTGTISSGYDGLGAFGAPAADLAGLSYTSVFAVTLPTPGAFHEEDEFHSVTYGGSSSGTPSPVSGKLTINGFSQTFSGNTYGHVKVYDGLGEFPGGYDGIFLHAEQDTLSYVADSTYSFVNSLPDSEDYPVTYDTQPGDIFNGSFVLDTGTGYSQGYFSPQRVTVALAATASLPEASTWAM